MNTGRRKGKCEIKGGGWPYTRSWKEKHVYQLVDGTATKFPRLYTYIYGFEIQHPWDYIGNENTVRRITGSGETPADGGCPTLPHSL